MQLRIHQPISRRWQIGLGVAFVVVLLLAYSALSHWQHSKNPLDTTIPDWGQLKDGLVKVFAPTAATSGEIWIWEDSWVTFGRLLLGLFIGAFASVILGVLMGCFRPVEATFLPTLAFLAKIPATAAIAIFLVLTPIFREIGVPLPVAVIVFGILPTLTQAVFQAAKEDVPDELIYKAFTLGASQAEIIWDVVIRYILPRMIESIRLQVGPAMVYLIAIEWIYTDDGFGYRLRIQTRLLNMSVVFVYLVALGVAGYLMDLALLWLRRVLSPWYGKQA